MEDDEELLLDPILQTHVKEVRSLSATSAPNQHTFELDHFKPMTRDTLVNNVIMVLLRRFQLLSLERTLLL